MKLGIIGAGRLGCALAEGLNRKGFIISGVYSKTRQSACRLADRLDVYCNENLSDVVHKSDVIFITVSDNNISKVADEIADDMGNEKINGKVFFHCSGALSSEILNRLAQSNGYTGSLHPVQSIPDRMSGSKMLEGIYFGFEGCEEAEKVAGVIVSVFKGKIINVDTHNKILYHAAACVLSNYTVVLSHIAENIYRKIGISGETGIKALYPLLQNTISNLHKYGSMKALTGPVERGDFSVVRDHLEMMSKKCPEFIEVYRILGETAVNMSLDKGSLDMKSAKKISKILSNNNKTGSEGW